MAEEKKIIIDEDWKKQVQEEREEAEPSENKKQPLPEQSFALFISAIATQAFIQLGEIDNLVTGKNEQNLDQAKYTIDTLKILEEKTKGNLTDDEKKYMDNLLYDLRTRYVQKVK